MEFLILDPHYTGPDQLEELVKKQSKAIYWADKSIFKPKSFYNFLLPQ